MPCVYMTIPEVDQSVSRPVIYNIIQSVQDILKIDRSSRIFYPGEITVMQQPGSNIDAPDRLAQMASVRGLYIEVEEDFDPEYVTMTAVSQPEHVPIFVDSALNISIKPAYATSSVTINFKYKTLSKAEAIRWRNDIRMRVSAMRDMNLHDISYHYLLPDEYIELLETLYDLREAQHGYGQTLGGYVLGHSTNRMTVISDLVNRQDRVAIAERQSRIVGLYSFDGIPDKVEREDSTGHWICSFGYRFNYEKPIGCVMRYPIIVHNQMIPSKYIQGHRSGYNIDDVMKQYPRSLEAFSHFEANKILQHIINIDPILRIPFEDDFIPENTSRGTGTLLFALCEVGTDSRTLLNLNELDYIALDPDILEFIRLSEYPYMGRTYQSIICLDLYRFDHLAASGTLQCDASLTVAGVAALDPRKEHRVRLGLVTDLTLLSKEAIERLLRYPKAFVKIISAINEILANYPGWKRLGDKRYITAYDFNDIYRYLTGFYYAGNTSIGNNMQYVNDPLVQYNYIQAGPPKVPSLHQKTVGDVKDWGRTFERDPRNHRNILHNTSTLMSSPRATLRGPGKLTDPLLPLRSSGDLEILRREQIRMRTLQLTEVMTFRRDL